MAKFKCPDGVSSVSVGGEQFNADDEGFIEAHDNLAGLLEPHGFTREKEPKPPQAGAEQAAPTDVAVTDTATTGTEEQTQPPAPQQSRRKAATAPQAGAEQAQE
ncbi:hypothetical protein ACUXVY_18965 [Chromobacterium haemolyticum]|uniref:hypothetical protein n=1 Tax=Chromobacterium haemolyticum TaxID=394935 RepID=UPI004057486F